MRRAQQSDISTLVVLFILVAFGLAALSQCRPHPAHASEPSAPACRRWKDGIYRRAVMRMFDGVPVIDYVYCKPAGKTTKR